ncbi:MAG: glycoside hydrolase family 99-like domain-containing protein, partial [Kosmotogaceae bacterium]|nr:glycoside hydrolase family 99-like domain-containing protein [Kosmotogaceae bacterium]
HGVGLFVFDWYAHAGKMSFQETLEQGFMQSSLFELTSFAIMWAGNFDYYYEGAYEDLLAVQDYLIEHYFSSPQYFRLEGRPVVLLLNVASMRKALGAAGVEALFADFESKAQDAGHPGVYLVSMYGDFSGGLDARAGFRAQTGYGKGGHFDGVWDSEYGSTGIRYGSYETLMDLAEDEWDAKLAALPDSMTFFPDVKTGWDSTAMLGERVTIDSTPENFEAMLRRARRFVDDNGIQPKLVMISAWDEWGEGSVLAPTVKYGFGMLEAVAEVFGSP